MSIGFWTDAIKLSEDAYFDISTGPFVNNALGLLAAAITGSTPDSLYRAGMLRVTPDVCEFVLHHQRPELLSEVWQRRDFYIWMYNRLREDGHEVRWPLAAWIVAASLYYVAYTNYFFDAAGFLAGATTNGVQAKVRTGNQVIFDDVLPKLKTLGDGPVLKGQAALDWDAETLSEEQELVQAMYDTCTFEEIGMFAAAAKMNWKTELGSALIGAGVVPLGIHHLGGDVPPFDETQDFTSVDARWRYGMQLGELFAPLGLPLPPRPLARDYYTSGAAFDAVNVRPNLHLLDANLDDNAPHAVALSGVLGSLSEAELSELFRDTDRRDQLIEHMPAPQLRHWILAQRVNLASQLDWVRLTHLRDPIGTVEPPAYDHVRDLVRESPQGQRDELKRERWKGYFVELCRTPQTLQTALADLGFDAATTSDWQSALPL